MTEISDVGRNLTQPVTRESTEGGDVGVCRTYRGMIGEESGTEFAERKWQPGLTNECHSGGNNTWHGTDEERMWEIQDVRSALKTMKAPSMAISFDGAFQTFPFRSSNQGEVTRSSPRGQPGYSRETGNP